MNDLASLLLWELGRATVLVALAAVFVALVLAAVRSRSPRVHRIACCAVLLQGWLLVRLPVAVPWYSAPKGAIQSPSLPGRGQGEGDVNSLSLDGRGLGEGDLHSLSLDGRGQGEGERVPVVRDVQSSQTVEPLNPRPSPNPSLAREGSFDESLSLDGRGQADGVQSLSLPGRGEGEFVASTTPLSSLAARIDRFAPALVALWLAGIVGCVALWLVGYVQFLRRLPAGLIADSEWIDQWRELQQQHEVRRPIPLRVTDDLGPLLCRRPRGYELLVPAGLWRELSPSQRSAILRHELAHYRRGDVWKSLAARVLALPQWFNPLVWLAVRRFDEAAEWACDLAATQGQPRATDYARALVRLGEAVTQHASYSPAAHGRTLAVRVRRLLSSGTLEDSIMKKIALMAAAAALVVVGIVRVELVAREPKTDDNVVEGAPQTPSAEAAANDSRDLLAAATDAAQEAQSKAAQGNYRAAAEAAAKAYEATRADYETDTVTLDLLYNASLRLLNAQRKLSQSTKDDVAAVEAYVERTQQIHDKVKALRDNGARGGEEEKYYSMVYYLEDAKEMLKAAKAKAAMEREKLKLTTLLIDPRASSTTGLAALQVRQGELFSQLERLKLHIATAESESKDSKVLRQLREEQRLLQEVYAKLERVISEQRSKVNDPRTLRFDGRTFDQWREELLTELKPERRTDAILAFRAFAANGYGRDAAQAIVDVMRGHDVWNTDVTPEGKLNETAVEAFGTIDRADAVPVLIEALKSGNANQRQFAARVFQDQLQGDKDAAAALIKAVSDPDAKVRKTAVNALTYFGSKPEGAARAIIAAMRDQDSEVRSFAIMALARPSMRGDEVARALIAAIANPEPRIRLNAINGLAQYNPRPEGLIPALRKALKDENADVVIAAIYALVPQANFAGGMSMGGGFGGMGREGMGMNMGGGMGMRMGGMGGGMAPGGRFGRGGGRYGGMEEGPMTPGMPPAGANVGGRGGPGLYGGAPPSVPTGLESIYAPEFLDLLLHVNEQVSSAAQSAISVLGPKCKPALPTALNWLRVGDSKKQRVAYGIIANIGPEAKEAVPELVKILDDSKRDVGEVFTVIQVLGEIGPAAHDAIPAIEKAIGRLPAQPGGAPGGLRGGPPGSSEQEQALEALNKIRKPAESPPPVGAPPPALDPNSQLPKRGPGAQAPPAPSPQTVTSRLLVKSTVGDAKLDPFEYNLFKQTQLQLIKGPDVLRLALREPGIAQLPIITEQPDPVQWLGSQLKLSYPGDSEVLEVSMSGDRPEQLVKLVNAIVDVYFKVYVWDATVSRKRDKDKLQQKYNDLDTRVAQLRKSVSELVKKLGVTEDGTIATRISKLVSELANLRQEQSNLSRQKTESELKVMQAATMLAVEKDPSRKEALIKRQIAEDPSLVKMRAEYDKAKQAVAAKPNDATQEQRETLKQMEDAIEKRKKDLTEKLADSTSDGKKGEWQANLDVSKHAVEKYQKLLEENAQAIEQRRKDLEGIKISSAELDQLREDIKQHEALRAKMFEELEARKREADAPARVERIEPARSPSDETRKPADLPKAPAP